MAKEFGAPAVVHSPKNQIGFFHEQAEKWKRSGSYKAGKGSRPRTNIYSKVYQDNFNSIDWGRKKDGKQSDN